MYKFSMSTVIYIVFRRYLSKAKNLINKSDLKALEVKDFFFQWSLNMFCKSNRQNLICFGKTRIGFYSENKWHLFMSEYYKKTFCSSNFMRRTKCLHSYRKTFSKNNVNGHSLEWVRMSKHRFQPPAAPLTNKDRNRPHF